MEKKISHVLFVCLGNICRSPCAEGIFLKYLKEKSVKNIVVESAGVSGYHEGEYPDSRMNEVCNNHGVILPSRARAVKEEDFRKFDLILAMDESVFKKLRQWHKGENVQEFVKYCSQDLKGVPDPYYGGPEGFENVFSIVDDGCQGILKLVISS